MSIITMAEAQLNKPLALVEANLRKPTGLFGRMVGHVMAIQHKTLTVWVINQMQIQPTDSILDVGCGGGMAIKLLAQQALQGQVAGVDYSPDMVAQASHRNRHAIRRGQVAIKPGNVASLPYKAAMFDKVCAIESFYFWPDPVGGLREIYRVLKPGGQVAIGLEMSKESSRQTAGLQKQFSQRYSQRSAELGLSICSGEELTAMLAEAGFAETAYSSEPDKSLGWLCALGCKPLVISSRS